jgi:hypothetical protein
VSGINKFLISNVEEGRKEAKKKLLLVKIVIIIHI